VQLITMFDLRAGTSLAPVALQLLATAACSRSPSWMIESFEDAGGRACDERRRRRCARDLLRRGQRAQGSFLRRTLLLGGLSGLGSSPWAGG
jgi:hypothetical protein